MCSENACAIPDPDKPGACKSTCQDGESCNNGECGRSRHVPTSVILCTDISKDENKFNCWEQSRNYDKYCQDVCRSNHISNDVCVNGKCGCQAGFVELGSSCVKITICDASNCQVRSDDNRCVSSCSGSETCQSGNCVEVDTTPGDTVSCIPGCERVNAVSRA